MMENRVWNHGRVPITAPVAATCHVRTPRRRASRRIAIAAETTAHPRIGKIE
jgi:hypothetical protein